MTDTDPRAANLERLFRPRSVAVIGASADPARIGGRPVRYLKEAGFAGPVYPINPKRDEVQGLRCYGSIADVPQPVDAVVVAVPAKAAIEAVRACAQAGAGGCVIFSADFAESGPDGAARQAALEQIAHKTGLRIIGPNCLGLFNAPSGAFLTFSSFFDRGISKEGRAALISQSGGFGSHLMEVVKARGVGVGTWITTGNEADVELGEALEWAAGQDTVDTILAYTEGVRDGAALARGLVAARAAGKPVIFMKSGRSQRGVAAASTHTAAMAGSDEMYQGLFDQFGVRRVYSAEEMADLAYMLSGRALPQNRDAALFTVSGAGGVQMSDSAEDSKLSIPVLPQAAQDEIKALASFAAPGNPVDFTAQALNDPSILPGVLEAVARHTEIGSFVIYLTITADDAALREQIFATLSTFARRHPDKLFVLCMLGSGALVRRYEEAGFRVFEDCARAVVALGRGLRATPVLSQPPPEPAIQRSALAQAAASESAGKRLLQELGIDVPRGAVGDTPGQMARLCEGWRFPVVAKIVHEDILHKSDIGGVRLGLGSPEAVRGACEGILSAVHAALPDLVGARLLVEEQISASAELILGIENDAALGPMVMLGFGGVQAEIYKDAVFRKAPVSAAEAETMIDALKGAAFFAPFRGREALDRTAVAQAVSALSRFAASASASVQSIDINPLLVGVKGQGALAADCVIVLKDNGGTKDD